MGFGKIHIKNKKNLKMKIQAEPRLPPLAIKKPKKPPQRVL